MSVGTFAAILTLIFITLKLTGYVAWGWFAVLAPLWIVFLVGILLALAMMYVEK